MTCDVLSLILARCDARGLSIARGACKLLRELAEEEGLWRGVFEGQGLRWRGEEWALNQHEEQRPDCWRAACAKILGGATIFASGEGREIVVRNELELKEALSRREIMVKGGFEEDGEEVDGGRGMCVLMAPGRYKVCIKVTNRVILRSQGGAVDIVREAGAQQVVVEVAAGGHLTAVGLTFSGGEGEAAVVVQGGEARLVCCDVQGQRKGLVVRAGGRGEVVNGESRPGQR